MQETKIDFVIPTLFSKPILLTSCKKSIIIQKGSFEKKIYVEAGYGFAEGVNKGIKNGKSPYVAVINDDVKLDENWLKEAHCVLDKNQNCAAVATRVLTYDGKYIDSCGMDVKREGKAKKRGNGEKKDVQKWNKIEEVFGVPCSAALFKREALEKVKLFDEDFIAYEEDVDISFRLRSMGYSIFYAPNAVAFHKMHATSDTFGNFKVRMDAKNWIFIIIKNYPFQFITQFAQDIFIERLRNLIGLINETVHLYRWKSFWVVPYSLLTTYGNVLRKFRVMMQKRSEIQRKSVIHYSELIQWMRN